MAPLHVEVEVILQSSPCLNSGPQYLSEGWGGQEGLDGLAWSK